MTTQDQLTDQERLVMAALLRTVIRLDGKASPEEREALVEVLQDALGSAEAAAEVPYRAGAAPPEVEQESVWDLLDRAAQAFPEDAAVRAAAEAVTRRSAQEWIYGAVHHVAASDLITPPEWPLLDWLRGLWKLPE